MVRRLPFSEQLRRAVEASELTRYRIAQETGISESILSRFVNRGAGLSMDSVDKLVDCLGLTLQAPKRPKRKRGN